MSLPSNKMPLIKLRWGSLLEDATHERIMDLLKLELNISEIDTDSHNKAYKDYMTAFSAAIGKLNVNDIAIFCRFWTGSSLLSEKDILTVCITDSNSSNIIARTVLATINIAHKSYNSVEDLTDRLSEMIQQSIELQCIR